MVVLQRAYKEQEKEPQCVYKEKGNEVIWETFTENLCARLGPIDCEDFDKSLLKIVQTEYLRENQNEFQWLGNQVKDWIQKTLIGTFMAG